MAKAKKQEALSVGRLINEVLVAQLSIPFRQIVNVKKRDFNILAFEVNRGGFRRIQLYELRGI